MYVSKFIYTQAIAKNLMSIERSESIVELMPIPAHLAQEKNKNTPITENFVKKLSSIKKNN